jgi:hypothetical protein
MKAFRGLKSGRPQEHVEVLQSAHSARGIQASGRQLVNDARMVMGAFADLGKYLSRNECDHDRRQWVFFFANDHLVFLSKSSGPQQRNVDRARHRWAR